MNCFSFRIHFVRFALLLAASPIAAAVAQTPTDADRAATMFAQGTAAAQKNDWENAYRLFQESWILNASYDTASNIGFSALKLKRHAEAARYLNFALRNFPTTGDRTKRNNLSRLLGIAKKQVTTVALGVEPANAEVLVNGTPHTGPSDSLFLDPGEHTIEVRAPGHEAERHTLVATPNEERELRIVLKQALAPAALPTSALPPATATTAPIMPADATPEKAPDGASDSGRSLVPVIVAGGIAAVGLAAGIGFTLSARSKQSDADDLRVSTGAPSGCAEPTRSAECDRLTDLENSEDRHGVFGAVGFVVGGAGAAAAIGYLLWPQSKPAVSAASAKRRFVAAPALGVDHAGFVVSSDF